MDSILLLDLFLKNHSWNILIVNDAVLPLKFFGPEAVTIQISRGIKTSLPANPLLGHLHSEEGISFISLDCTDLFMYKLIA